MHTVLWDRIRGLVVGWGESPGVSTPSLPLAATAADKAGTHHAAALLAGAAWAPAAQLGGAPFCPASQKKAAS